MILLLCGITGVSSCPSVTEEPFLIMKTVAAIHTAMPMVEPTTRLFSKHLPGVRLIHIVDTSLIEDVIRNGGVEDAVNQRLRQYYDSALLAGADLIFNTCSSVGDVAIDVRRSLDIPLVKIDDAMAERAVRIANDIGVLATISTTLEPTVRLLKHFASRLGKDVLLHEGLAEGAFEASMQGQQDRHDGLILEAAAALADRVELFVLAQGSMARMEKELEERTGKKVFSSPESGVLAVKEFLRKSSREV